MNKLIILICISIISFASASKKNLNTNPKENVWVFVMAGQSNMAGRGIVEAQDTLTDARILTVNKDLNLEIAQEPLHFYEPSLAGLDAGHSFAKKLKAHIPKNIKIVLLPCIVGGSSISQWVGDSIHRNVKLYSNFKKRVTYSKTIGTVKGVLWHQGESDAHDNSLPQYQSQLELLFQKFRKEVGIKNLPIIVGELGEFAEPEERNLNWKLLNEILHKMAKNDAHLYIVSSKGLKSNPDKIHFNSEAQRELGLRYTNQFLNIKK